MAQLVEYVDELIQEVGPRPAGTLQEHQAAELIAARLDGFGMSVDIEEFSCARNHGWVRALYYALCVIGAVATVLTPLPVLGVVLVVIGAILMALDYMGRNPLYSLFNNSLSQNVIARFTPPGNEHSAHIRKVVVVAHYDSPRTMVQAAPPLVVHYATLRRLIRVIMGVLVVFAALMLVPFPAIFHSVVTVVMGIAAAIVLLALLAEIINFFMPYSQGANSNGSSIGALYGLAQILSSGVDVASFRNATGQTKRRKTEHDESVRANREARAAARSEGRSQDTRHNDTTGPTTAVAGTVRAGAATAGAAGATGQMMGSVRRRGERQAPGDGQAAAQAGAAAGQDTQGMPQAAGDGSGTAPQISIPGGPVRSVGDQLVNPFISQRPPLAQIEEEKRLRDEEREKRLEEQRKRLQQESGYTNAGVPSWYANAKKKAEEKVERKHSREDDANVIRSRFADVPITGRAADAADTSAGEELKPTQADGQSEGSGDVQGAVAVTAGEPGFVSRRSVALPTLEATFPWGAAQEQEAVYEQAAALEKAVAPSPAVVRPAVPVTIQPDFSGLDKEAFRVIPSEQAHGAQIIVPGQTSVQAAVPQPTIPAGYPNTVASETDAPFEDEPIESIGVGSQATLFPGSEKRNRLQDLPSLSLDTAGGIPVQQATLDEAPIDKEELFSADSSLVNATGAFVPLGTTGIMKPLGEELLEYHDASEIYVHDADDASMTEHYSQTGEYSEPELVNIPESRVKSFFGSVGDRFSGKKKEKLNDAPSSWLGVDKRYDARREGNNIGTWDNFHDDDDEWAGGAYGGSDHQENVNAVMNLSNELLNKEVWLVALGANEAKNAGLKNLLASHASELKNALFINILGVGIGDLVFTVSEGNYHPAQTDPRMQSIISTAAQGMAIPIGPVEFNAFSTDATAALREGARAISIMGLSNKTPVGWRWSDDETANLREDNLLDAVALVIETIKNA